MDIRRVIDARDALQRRLDALRREYDRTGMVVYSSRARARLSRVAKEIDRLERGVARLNDLAADLAEGLGHSDSAPVG